jgi:hypothetical protein
MLVDRMAAMVTCRQQLSRNGDYRRSDPNKQILQATVLSPRGKMVLRASDLAQIPGGITNQAALAGLTERVGRARGVFPKNTQPIIIPTEMIKVCQRVDDGTVRKFLLSSPISQQAYAQFAASMSYSPEDRRAASLKPMAGTADREDIIQNIYQAGAYADWLSQVNGAKTYQIPGKANYEAAVQSPEILADSADIELTSTRSDIGFEPYYVVYGVRIGLSALWDGMDMMTVPTQSCQFVAFRASPSNTEGAAFRVMYYVG